jgi:hypothetical protein
VGLPKPLQQNAAHFVGFFIQDCRFSLRSKRLPKMAGVPKPFQQYRVAISLGFLLLICLQKRAFDTASKQKTLSLL